MGEQHVVVHCATILNSFTRTRNASIPLDCHQAGASGDLLHGQDAIGRVGGVPGRCRLTKGDEDRPLIQQAAHKVGEYPREIPPLHFRVDGVNAQSRPDEREVAVVDVQWRDPALAQKLVHGRKG